MSKDRSIEAVFVKGCADLDGDGFKAPPGPGDTCNPGPQVDCNDGEPAVNPGMTEICGNTVDEDCSGTADACTGLDKDDDNDGFTETQGDCNDANNAIYPGATEIPDNNIDEDCFDGDKEIGVEETCVTPSDVPANTAKKPAPPLIMFLLDDSGSMDWEFMTSEYYQLYENRYFVYAYHQNSRAYADTRLDAGQRREYLSQFAGYNRIYFNPTTNYDPWPKWDEVVASVTTSGTERVLRRTSSAAPENGIEKRYDTDNTTFPDIAFRDEFVHADMDNPRTNTVVPGKGYPMAYIDRDGITQTMDLNAEFFRVKNLPQQVTVYRDSSSTGLDTRADAIGLSTRSDLHLQTQPIAAPTPRYCTDVNNNVPALADPDYCYELSPWGDANRPDAPEIIFDNDDTDIFTRSANWDPATGFSYWQWGQNSGAGKTGTSYWTDNTGTWATWRMNVPAGMEGDYYIYAWINDFANSDGAARYTITYFDTATNTYVSRTPARVNQRPDNPVGGTVEGPRWVRLENRLYHFKVQTGATDIIVPNAHYFTWYDADNDGVRDNLEIYLVTIPGTGRTIGSYTLNYYRFNDISNDLQVDDGELTQLIPGVDDTEIDRIKPVRFDENGDPITDSAQLAYVVRQNFADWFSFYRRRILTSKAAVGLTVYDMERVSLGVYAINRSVSDPLKYMEIANSTDKTNYLRTIYQTPPTGNTPLRRALGEVGQYFLRGTTGDNANLMTNEGLTSASDSSAANASVFWDANSDVDTDTIDDSGGECQRAFVIAMTDGYYNEAYTIANQDTATNGWPYALQDTAADGLSDIANRYYRMDLDSGLDNELTAKGFDEAPHQHLVMYGVSFGVFGNFDPNMYPDCLPECTTPGEDGCPELADIGKIIPGTPYVNRVQMPDSSFTDTPTTSTGPWSNACPRWNTTNTIESPAAVDDLFHASVNGRGEFLNAGDPAELVASLKKIKDLIEENQGTAASVSINANKIEANTLVYQTSYDSGDWSGDVEAKCLDVKGNIASCEAVSCSSTCDTAYATCSAICTIGDTACEQVCTDARTACYTTNNCTSYMTCGTAHTNCVSGCDESCTSTCTVTNAACVTACAGDTTCIAGCSSLDNACYTSCTTTCKNTCDATKATCNDDPPEVKWSASDKLESVDWDDRNIITSNAAGSGLAFRWGDTNDATPDGLTNAMKATFGGQQRLLEYLRGDNSCEADNTTGCVLDYRVRSSKLGDFINSEPYYFKSSNLGINWVFTGANDGMLHVFNSSTGDELFAFIPYTVFGNLKELSDPGYNDIHKFYVDGYVTAKNLGDATILVGGLGKGGKGFYALDIDAAATAVATNDVEGSAQSIVKWEYNALTQAADPAIVANLGYSFSRPQIVKSNDPSAAWLLVFGNGYDSPSGHAVLFLVGLDTDGDIVWTHMIDTGVGDTGPNCNGLSTPAIVAPPGDTIDDFLYAGDLLGNMWKFDISSTDRGDWDVYFKEGTINKPLFEARSNPTGTTLYRQPITMMPDITSSCINGTEGLLITFGTGRLLDPDVDSLDQSIQTMYGIWDWSAEWALQGKDPHAMYLGHFMPKTTAVSATCEATCNAELGDASTADTCLYNCLGNSECELECIEVADSCSNNCSSVRNLSNMANILGDASSAQYVALLEQRQISVLGLRYNSDGSIKDQVYGETNVNAVDEVVRTVSDNEINWLLPMENDGILEPDEYDLYINDTSKKISHVGWYFDLPENGERAVKDVRIVSGKLIFTTNTPSSSPCVGGGTSQLWAVEACTGGRSKHAYFDMNGDGVIDEKDYINIGTAANPKWIAPSSIKLEGIAPSASMFEVERNLSVLYFPDSRRDEKFGKLPVKPFVPIRYWRELDWQ
jgi:type IV pilus assembly protein PilY1